MSWLNYKDCENALYILMAACLLIGGYIGKWLNDK